MEGARLSLRVGPSGCCLPGGPEARMVEMFSHQTVAACRTGRSRWGVARLWLSRERGFAAHPQAAWSALALLICGFFKDTNTYKLFLSVLLSEGLKTACRPVCWGGPGCPGAQVPRCPGGGWRWLRQDFPGTFRAAHEWRSREWLCKCLGSFFADLKSLNLNEKGDGRHYFCFLLGARGKEGEL